MATIAGMANVARMDLKSTLARLETALHLLAMDEGMQLNAGWSRSRGGVPPGEGSGMGWWSSTARTEQ